MLCLPDQGVGIGDFDVLGELFGGFFTFFEVDAEESECRVVLVFQPDVFLNKGHFLAANPAPTGGELYHDDFSFQIF